METSIKKILRAVRRKLNEKSIDALLITKAVNVTYLSAFSGDDSWLLVAPKGV